MHSFTSTSVEALDDTWYRQLKPLLEEVGETFVTLMPSDMKLQRLRNEFVASGYKTITDLYPEVPDADQLTRSRGKLTDLKQTILASETSPEIRMLYYERIHELILNIDMILAAKQGNDQEFHTINRAIYGDPDPHIFTAACRWIRHDAGENKERLPEGLYDEIMELVPDVVGDTSVLFPNNAVFRRVKSLHFQPGGYCEHLFDETTIPEGKVVTPEIGDPITRQVIRNVGSSFDLVDSPSGLWSVLQSQAQVIRPAEYSLTTQAFRGIIAHEVGSHLLESTSGANSPLRLLELGLDRYECGNEGRAFLREQIMYDHITNYVDQPLWRPTKASWEYRIAIHLLISLAVGLHGRPYAFGELYHLLTVIFRFWTAKRGEDVNEKIIHDGAWSMATRALKGTNGHGGAYLKDIVYLEGNIRCWQAATTNPDLILYGDLGKFDIANPRHVQALTSLGILPAHP